MSMTREEMIQIVMSESEETDEDVVGYYLDNAAEIILNQRYPHEEDWEGVTPKVPSRYLHLQTRMAVILLNKRGADGESMHVENGINRHYGSADIPADLLRQIVPKAVAF